MGSSHWSGGSRRAAQFRSSRTTRLGEASPVTSSRRPTKPARSGSLAKPSSAKAPSTASICQGKNSSALA